MSTPTSIVTKYNPRLLPAGTTLVVYYALALIKDSAILINALDNGGLKAFESALSTHLLSMILDIVFIIILAVWCIDVLA